MRIVIEGRIYNVRLEDGMEVTAHAFLAAFLVTGLPVGLGGGFGLCMVLLMNLIVLIRLAA